jgi:hypothetical protein
VVAHTCNPGYAGTGAQWDYSSKPSGHKVSGTPISPNKLSMVVNICCPRYVGDKGRRIMVLDWPRPKARPYLEN